MQPAQIIDEARRLARPCLRLSASPQTTSPIGWWGAHRSRRRADGLNHLLMLDLAGFCGGRFGLPSSGTARLFLDRSRLRAALELDADRPNVGGLREAERAWADISNPFTGASIGRKLTWKNLDHCVVPLWGVADTSIPWVDDLFRSCSGEMLAWIRSLGWDPEWGYNSNFRGAEVMSEYERYYFDQLWGTEHTTQLTLARNESFAVLGGWPFPLDGQPPPQGDLVLTAFACSEPQVEIWRVASGDYRAITRVT